MVRLYGLKNCDSCRKARKWLDSHGTEYEFLDVREDGLTNSDLRRWLSAVDWGQLLNTRSTTWREIPKRARADITKQKAMALMLDHPTLVKRPVLEHSDTVTIGFSDAKYREIKFR